jgi:hypothetical protein
MKKTLPPRIKEILRWVAVLPGGLICAVLSTIPVHLFVLMIHASRNTDTPHTLSDVPPEILERFGYAFFTPFVLIFVGSKITPRFQFYTSIALAVLWGILFGIGVSVAYSRGTLEGYSWFRSVITCLLGIAGTALGLYLAYKADDDFLFKRDWQKWQSGKS